MKALILIILTGTFHLAHAQSTPNFLNFTDADLAQVSYNPIQTAYSINRYVEETSSFQNALKSYFLVRSQSSQMSFDIQSYLRTQDGIWWETTAQKRRTIYQLKFAVYNYGRHLQDCQMNFSRVESQTKSSTVAPSVSTLLCVAAPSPY